MADFTNTIIYGYLHVHESVVFNQGLYVADSIKAKTIELTETDANIAPIVVTSTALCVNLNSDYLDSHSGEWYQNLANATGTLSDDRLAVNSITLTKLKYINNGTVLGRQVNATGTSGPVTQLVKADIKPIVDVYGTNRGDQAVFDEIMIINRGTTDDDNSSRTAGPKAVAPAEYDPTSSIPLNERTGDKKKITFKMGENITFVPYTGTYTNNGESVDIDNALLVKVGLKLTDNILKGTTNTDSPTGSYSPYTEHQSGITFDTSSTEPSNTSRLNLNAALHASRLYVADINNQGQYFRTLTTQKDAIDAANDGQYRLAFFSPYNSTDGTKELGYDIVMSQTTIDDTASARENVLWSSLKYLSYFDDFRLEYIDSRIYGSVGTLDALTNLSAEKYASLEDGLIILVRSEGLYRLSKFESIYTEANGKYVIAIQGQAEGKWIKIADKIAYHNTTGDIQGGSASLNEYYHLTQAQHDMVHASNSDNQTIKSGVGMDFKNSDADVTIDLGQPSSANENTINAVTQHSHTHTLETYDLEAAPPIYVTEGAKILGSKAIIKADYATTDQYGVTILSNSYSGTDETLAVTELALSNGLDSVVSCPLAANTNTTIGYIPVWNNTLGTRITTGYAVSTNYDNFKTIGLSDKNYTSLNNSIVRADIIKKYVDNIAETLNLLLYKGAINCSANPNYPAGLKGETYIVTAEGRIGGANGERVETGDFIICNTKNDGGTQETVGASWDIIQGNTSDVVVNSSTSLAGNFAMFTDATGKVVSDTYSNKTYNADSFQPKSTSLTNLAALSTSGIAVYNSSTSAWVARTITTEATDSTNGVVITNGNGVSGNTVIKHADTSSQASISALTNTWINSITIDTFGHVTKLTTSAHPTQTARSIVFPSSGTSGLSTVTTSGIKSIDTLVVTNDANGHVTALSATDKYLPIASTSTNGVLTSTDWNTFNGKASYSATTLDGTALTNTVAGNIPTWKDTTNKSLTNGYSVENTTLSSSTSNNHTLPTTNLLYTYINGRVDYKNSLDCSASPNYPTGIKGDMYIVSVDGKIGGSSGKSVWTGDIILCLADDTAGNTAANWTVYRKNRKKLKKVITATAGATSFSFADVIDASNDYEISFYRNGIFQLENDTSTTYDYSLNTSTRTITVTTAASADEKILVLIEVF